MEYGISLKFFTLVLRRGSLGMYRLYIDGASKGNPGPAAIGIVIETEAGSVIDLWGEYIGISTNNVAEYTALIYGLERAKELSIKNMVVFSDSKLLVNQLNSTFRVTSEKILPLYNRVKQLETNFITINYVHIPREKNSRADSLASKALSIRGKYPP